MLGSVAAIGRAMARLRCPQIVAPTHARIAGSGRCAIESPLLEGRPLAAVALDRSVPMAARFGILRQLIRALSAAHDGGVIHGTLSATSVVVAPDLRQTTRVTDYGVSRIVGDYLDHPTEGMPLSPERMLGMEIGPAEDVYLFGCLAFYTLAGWHPFTSATEDERRRRHAIEDPPELGQAARPRRVKASMAAVVRRCLAKEAEDRYPDATALEIAWCQAQIDAGIATAWDELPLPTMPATQRDALRRGLRGLTQLRRPSTRPPGIPSPVYVRVADDESLEIDIDVDVEDSVPIRIDDTDTIIVDVPYR